MQADHDDNMAAADAGEHAAAGKALPKEERAKEVAAKKTRKKEKKAKVAASEEKEQKRYEKMGDLSVRDSTYMCHLLTRLSSPCRAKISNSATMTSSLMKSKRKLQPRKLLMGIRQEKNRSTAGKMASQKPQPRACGN